MKELVTSADAWSAIAPAYDKFARQLLTPFSAEAVRLAGLDDTDDVIDVACGPGTTTLLAAEHARSVQAVDFASRMITALRMHTAGMANVESQIGDGQKLMFENSSFSVAFSMFGLMFFPEPVAGLRELHRVLKPNGRVVISSWPPIADSPRMAPLMQAVMHALPEDDKKPPEPFAFETPEALRAGLAAGGFVDVEIHEFTPDVPVVSPQKYWSEARENIFMAHLREKSGDAWEALEAKILGHLEESLGGVDTLAMPALIGIGRRP